ncbi:MAG TPA: lipid A export permease/ATP-binding protein MsbA [Gammaproteobacteria bacterium]|nr:lipid A export permease/ATP-binding protein MsbA [Gammaproteobacteria bacterium]
MFGLSSQTVAVYRRLLGYLEPAHWRVLGAASAASVVYAGVGVLVPQIMAEITEGFGTPNRTLAEAIIVPIIIVAALVVRGIVDFLIVYGMSWVGRAVVRDVRSQLFDHYLGLPARFYDANSTGLLISKLTYNTEQVADATSNAVVVLVRDSLTILGSLLWMVYKSPTLMLLVVVVVPSVGFVINAMSRGLRRYSERIQSSMGDVTRVTEQSLQGQRVVKIFGGQKQETEQFDEINRRNFRMNMRLIAVRAGGDSLSQAVVVVGVAAVVFVASWVLPDVTASLFVGFTTAMGMVVAPFRRLVNINAVWQRGVAAADSLFATLDEPVENDSGVKTLGRARGDVEYRNVSFAYDPAKGNVFQNLSLAVPAGTSVALVGQSGSGKSTLVSLLPRFYDADSGSVLLDGADVRDYKLRDLRRQISLVSQDVVLFDDTIANNIAYGSLAERSREEIERAAEAAYVTEFAAGLPNGLDTRVGERGALLSGGQRQRVAIARALLKDAPVLILDEATSALDTESERRIQSALARLMQGRTTLVIAHRLSTIERADRIVVMRDGAIVETGNHEQLLERRGYYSSLHSLQFTS